MMTVRDFTALTTGSAFRDADGAVRTAITFGFADQALPYLRNDENVGNQALLDSIEPLNDGAKAQARAALDQWASVSALTFTEVAAENADIVFYVADFALDPETVDFLGFAFLPENGVPRGGDVFIDNDSTAEPGLYLHEIGHALGLDHPFEGDRIIVPELDHRANSVLGNSELLDNTLGVLDIQAIQSIYGAPEVSPVLAGDSEENTLRGGADGDVLIGLRGADMLRGGGGSDVLSGGAGRDTIIGGRGKDAIDGGAGHDRLAGRGGTDEIVGGAGADTLRGNRGNDTLKGDAGKDVLLGGLGADQLFGGEGNDVLIGGRGGDNFFFSENGGRDRIADFDPLADLIRIDGVTQFSDLNIKDVNGNALVEFNGIEVVVEDVRASSLTSFDFGLEM